MLSTFMDDPRALHDALMETRDSDDFKNALIALCGIVYILKDDVESFAIPQKSESKDSQKSKESPNPVNLCCEACPIKKDHIKCTSWIQRQRGCLRYGESNHAMFQLLIDIHEKVVTHYGVDNEGAVIMIRSAIENVIPFLIS